MRKGWEYKKLGEVCDITMGQSPDGNSINEVNGVEFHQGKTCFGERFLGVSPLYSNAPTKLAEAHSVLLCVRAPVGYPNITDRKICIGRGLCALYAKGEIDNTFLYYSLLGKQSYFEKNATGSTFKAISSKIVSNTTLSIPPKSTQLAIVSELDKINELIRLKKEQLKDFDNLAQSLFYEMFGDPVENEKGWEVKKIKDIAKYYNGVAHEQDVDKDGDFVLINAKFISSEGQIKKYTSIQRFPLLKNDIVMVLSDLPNGKSLAKCFLIDEDNKYTLNQRICCFRGFEGSSVYLKNIINRNPYLLSFDNGKGQTNLRKGDVEKIPIPLPPLPLQRLFAQRIEQIEREKSEVQNPSRISKPCWLPACNTGSNRAAGRPAP